MIISSGIKVRGKSTNTEFPDMTPSKIRRIFLAPFKALDILRNVLGGEAKLFFQRIDELTYLFKNPDHRPVLTLLIKRLRAVLNVSNPSVAYYSNPSVTYYSNPSVTYYSNPFVAYYSNPSEAYNSNLSVAYYSNPSVAYYSNHIIVILL